MRIDEIMNAQLKLELLRTIEKAIDRISGVSIKVKALTEKEFSSQYPDFKEKKSLLQEAVDIFGGKIISE